MGALDHPCKPLIEAVRSAILAADTTIAEGIKWNAPSFRTTEYFATMNLRQKRGIALILHLGAKVREAPPGRIVIDDAELMKWLAKDRAMITFESLEHLEASRPTFERIVRQWIQHV